MQGFLVECRTCLWLALVGGAKFIVFAGLIFVVAVSALFLVLRFVDPPTSAFMLRQSLTGRDVTQSWVPLSSMSKPLVRAVVSAEDARFCRHRGIDTVEFNNALRQARRQGDLAIRGASTISMQVVKNLFLWPNQSYLRKGLELAITPLMELIWPKSRILEVYLNIAEWGPGVFGAEAAARYHFKKSARRITINEATLLAKALPSPVKRKAGKPTRQMRRLARRLRTRVRRSRLDLRCLS